MSRPAWFPDWSGETCALVGSGESATPDALATLRGRCRVMVINSSFRLAPWADALYACDGKWWNHSDNSDALQFAGLKITQDESVARLLSIHRVTLVEQGAPKADTILTSQPGILGRGGNGGHQALNLLVQFGVRRVLALLDYRGEHWHGNHPPGLSNPRPAALAKWARTMDAQAPRLKRLGVELIDVAHNGALTAYPKMTIEEAVQ